MKSILLLCTVLSIAYQAQWLVLDKAFFSAFPNSELDPWTLNIPKTDIITQCGSQKLVGGYKKFSQMTKLQRIYDNIPQHSKIRASFRLYQIDTWEENERSKVLIDNNTVFTRYQPHNEILSNLCGGQSSKSYRDVVHEVTIVEDHNSDTMTIVFTENLDQNPNNESWGISHLFIEYYGECTDGIIMNDRCVPNNISNNMNVQECHDHLGTLMDQDGNTLMTNICEPILDAEQNQLFKFTTQFLAPYVFDDECLDIRVFFGSEEVLEGDGAINFWSFDPETQEIVWNIKLEDFVDVYGCQWIEEDDQFTWLCDFKVNLYFMDMEQQCYSSKIRVTVDRIKQGVLEVDVQKNEVLGVCCENELKIQTELRFCTDISCTSFIDGVLNVIRKEDFFVEQRIITPGFSGFYLKELQVKLGDFFPVIVSSDSSQPGRLILQLRSNIAKPNLILQVISQLHKTKPSRLLRFLQVNNEEIRDDYKLINYDQLSIVPNPDNNNNQGGDDMEQPKFVVKENQSLVNNSVLKASLIVSGVLVVAIIVGTGCCIIRRRKLQKQKYME